MFEWKKWLPLIHAHLMQVAAVNSRKFVLLPLESFQISHAFVRSILWVGDLQPSFHMYSLAPQATDWFVQGKGVAVRILVHAQDSNTSMMVPNLNSVVFYSKTTTWPCLSGTTCSHVCSRTSSCFGACYRSSFPENLATPSRRFVLQTFFSDMPSLKYLITNRIWISGRYDGWNISQEL